MAKMIILRGVSGSGKSTWAKMQHGAVVISRDAIRVMLYGPVADTPEYYNVENQAQKDALAQREHRVTLIEHGMIVGALKGGTDVIVDNTNIEWKFVMGYVKRARKLGAEVEVKVFDVPLQRAINNNTWRAANGGRDVPRNVIEKQHSRFQGNKNMVLEPAFVPTPYTGTPGMPKAFLVDIDGTLAHMRDYRGPFDWKKVGLDDVDDVIAEVVGSLFYGNDYEVIVMSGRDESCRSETIAWLNQHDIAWDFLFMRPEKDMRPDNIVKAELFDNYVRGNFDVRFVLDDRNQVVDMWRKMGLTCLQVAEGDF